MLFNKPSFKFALRSEGEKGENKTGAKFSLYAYVCQSYFTIYRSMRE